MRDKRFVAEHRGGPLTMDRHRLLMKWACDCARHILPLVGKKPDARLENALRVAGLWRRGRASVGQAREASVAAIAAANESPDPVAAAVARAVGHAVATAHMADHALGPALYALKALKIAGKPVDTERKWQEDHLPPEIKDLVLTTPKYKYIERI